MDSEVSQSSLDLDDSIQAVERAITITNRLLHQERESLEQDRFGRRPSDMPPSLRHLYRTGLWRSHSVYLWPAVLHLSRLGHRHAAQAEAALDMQSYRSSTLRDGKAIASAAIADAVAVNARIADRVRKVVAAQRAARRSRLKAHSRVYMQKRRLWVQSLDEVEAKKTGEEREEGRQRDRELLKATRRSSGVVANMTSREVDLIFSEFDAAGGTAGGLERWGRSITGIPEQNFDVLPAPVDGGGVLISNPLMEHYMVRNINPWTRAERLLFLEKYVVHGKNFRKIATFFEHKSVEDCVRFYYDNKIHYGLKHFNKDSQMRKRGNKKVALAELSKLPIESRSIKDNFMHQPGFLTPDEPDELEKEYAKAEKLSTGTLGRNWTKDDRQALVFALCRYDVTGDEEGKAVPTVWANIAAAVGNKTPRQCRQFYFQYKTALGLDSYSPPKPAPRTSGKRTEPPDGNLGAEESARKLLRRSNSMVRGVNTGMASSVGDYYVSSAPTAGRIA